MFQGTTTEQDNRFSDKEKKLLKQMKFSDCLSQRVMPTAIIFDLFIILNLFQVDMSKIKLDVIKPWIQDKITEILKIDDDVVVDFVYNQLDEKVN